ncbi:hypothetical protein D3C79_1112160 [compost metagenome]
MAPKRQMPAVVYRCCPMSSWTLARSLSLTSESPIHLPAISAQNSATDSEKYIPTPRQVLYRSR